MKRDFSEKAYQELLTLVKQVEDEKWWDFTDEIGDGWLDFQGWIGMLNIKHYVDNIYKYHKKVIDKNDAAASDIETIFTNVNNYSTNYRGRFLATLTDLQEYCRTVNNIASIVSPGNGSFSSERIQSELKSNVTAYLKESELLQMMAGDGLTEEKVDEIEETDPDLMKRMLDALGRTYINAVPNVSVSDTVEIPVGPSLVFYYGVEVEGDIGSNIDIKAVIEEQRLQLKEFSVKTDGLISIGVKSEADGKDSISVSSNGTGMTYDNENGLTGYSKVKIDNTTYTLKITGKMDEVKVEESVTTEVDGGKVTSKIGIKKKNNIGWEPIPEYVPVEAPYPGVIPELDINWGKVKDVVVDTVVAVVEIAVIAVAVAAAIYFCPQIVAVIATVINFCPQAALGFVGI